MKGKRKTYSVFYVVAAVIWFIFISYFMAHTGYQHTTTAEIVGPQNVSTTFGNIVSILVAIVSLYPSGLAFGYAYISTKNPAKTTRLGVLVSAITITIVLYVLFGWYNFIINFSR